jgi:tetratricopeptide (TPR) repeat protein
MRHVTRSCCKKYLFPGWLLCIFVVQNIYAQREIVIRRSLVVDCPNPSYHLNQCDYGLLVPASIPGKQEVLEYKYLSLQPDHVTRTENNEYYLKWKKVSFSLLTKGHMEVSMRIRIKPYDLQSAKKHPVFNKGDNDTLPYLKDEENFRYKAKNIREASEQIKGSDREELVKNIFQYVVNALDYHIYFYQDRGARQALKDGKGDCTEYSELMVTLCRSKNIPARIVMGLIPGSDGQVGYHNWVEAFFPSYGWVAFDPTWADHPKATTTFYTMKNTYVQLSNKRFINTVLCPCYGGEQPFSLSLKDTCAELSGNIGKKIREMYALYKAADNLKTAVLLDTLLKYEPDNYSFWAFRGVVHARLGNFEQGEDCLRKSVSMAETSYQKNTSLYAFANFYALKGEGENAVKYLKEAITNGFDAYHHFLTDRDFEKIKDDPSLIAFKEELKAREKEKGKKEK